MALPFTLANGKGNLPDATQLMANFNALVQKIGDTMTGALILPAGTVGAPSLGVGGATDGFYKIGTNQIGFVTNGVLRLTMSTTAFTAALPLAMGANKITGLGAGTALGDALSYGQSVVQVVGIGSSVDTAVTSSTFQVTTSTLSITPKSASNKILLFATGALSVNNSGVNAFATISRNGASIVGGSGGVIGRWSTGATLIIFPISLVALDAPATTSAITYAVYVKNSDNTSIISYGNGSGSGVIATLTAIEIGA